MNYFLQINSFYESLETKPLKPPAIALWHALMNIANKSGWPAALTVSIKALSMKTGMNEKAVERARNTLAQTGYVHWKPRGGSASAAYIITNLYDKNIPQNVGQPVGQSVGINKLELELEPNIPHSGHSQVCEGVNDVFSFVEIERVSPVWRDLLEDVICEMWNSESISVGGSVVGNAAVRARLLQLDYSAVESVLTSIEGATGEVQAPRRYLMACLYNAPVDFGVAVSVDVARNMR